MIEQMFYVLLEIILVGFINFSSDPNRCIGCYRNFNSTVAAFFRRNTAEEGKIISAARSFFKKINRQTMVYPPHKIGLRQWLALRIGDTNNRLVGIGIIDHL